MNKKNLQQKIFGARKQSSSGFTLLEVTFVIAIFAIMASIVLFNFRNFGTHATVDNLVQDVALRIVEAQKSAISGVLPPSFTGAIAPSYGVYFVSGVQADTDNHEFTYFSDLNANKLYDAPASCPAVPTPGNECISVTGITTGEYVSNICYTTSATGSSVPCVPVGAAHVTFTRPFPDATIEIWNSVGAPSATLAAKVYIEITSSLDPSVQKTIIVTNLGEVRVYNGCEGLASGGLTCS